MINSAVYEEENSQYKSARRNNTIAFAPATAFILSLTPTIPRYFQINSPHSAP
jgi:hypothetical protein